MGDGGLFARGWGVGVVRIICIPETPGELLSLAREKPRRRCPVERATLAREKPCRWLRKLARGRERRVAYRNRRLRQEGVGLSSASVKCPSDQVRTCGWPMGYDTWEQPIPGYAVEGTLLHAL